MGGAARGVMSAIYLLSNDSVNPSLPLWIIDVNPKKQGKFVSSSGLRIFSPKEFFVKAAPNDQIFVANPVYLSEVKDLLDREPKFDVEILAIEFEQT